MKQNQYYALSAQKAKEVIDNKATWGYELMPSFASLWDEAGNFNHETIFGAFYNANVPDAWGNNSGMQGPIHFSRKKKAVGEMATEKLIFIKNFLLALAKTLLIKPNIM